MKLNLSLVAAAATIFAVGVAAYGDRNLLGPQTGDDVTRRLGELTEQVSVIRQGFVAYINGDNSIRDDKGTATLALLTSLNDTATYLSYGRQDLCDNFGDKDSLKIRQSYQLLSGNITVITTSLKKNIKKLRADGRGKVLGKLLPHLETASELLYQGLSRYISPKYAPSLAAIAAKLDDEFESTLHAYGVNDASNDDNRIAGPNDFPPPVSKPASYDFQSISKEDLKKLIASSPNNGQPRYEGPGPEIHNVDQISKASNPWTQG